MKKIYQLIGIIALLGLAACEDVLDINPAAGDGSLELSAYFENGFVKSRASDGVAFRDGKLILLYGTGYKNNTEFWRTNMLLDKSIAEEDVPADKPLQLAFGMTQQDATRTPVTKIINSPAHVENHKIADEFYSKPLNFYGVSVSHFREAELDETEYLEAVKKTNSLVENFHNYQKDYNDIPHVITGYNTETPVRLYDIMWSGTMKNLEPYNSAGKITLPFYHTLSKLNFYAVLADNIDSSINSVTIKELAIHDYYSGAMCLSTGLYEPEKDDSGNDIPRQRGIVDGQMGLRIPIEDLGYGVNESYLDSQGRVVIDSQYIPLFASTLVFPTTGAKYSFNTPNNSSSTEIEKANEGDELRFDLIIEVAGKEKRFEKVLFTNSEGNAQVFHPNGEYDVTFVLTTNSVVVTIKPTYYEYIQERVPLNPNEIGEPVEFGGLLWAAENLGATSANPLLNAHEWEKSRGFYYQYGRNIPYYVRCGELDPYPNVAVYDSKYEKEDGTIGTFTYSSTTTNYKSRWDGEFPRYLDGVTDPTKGTIPIPYSAGKTGYDEKSKTHGARVYPYIPALWEKLISDLATKGKSDRFRIDNGYKKFLEECRYYSPRYSLGQTSESDIPDINYSDPYFVNQDVNGVPLINNSSYYNRFAYSAYYPGTYNFYNTRYWDKNNDFAGNYPTNWDQSSGGSSDPCPKGWRLPTAEEFLSIFPVSQRTGDITFNGAAFTGGDSNKDSRTFIKTCPYEDRTNTTANAKTYTVEDYMKEPSVYVGILQDGSGYNDLKTLSVDSKEYAQGWGSIYAIKRKGTKNAYLVRWKIEMADYGFDEAQQKFVKEAVASTCNEFDDFDMIGRGVLVIERFELGEYANLMNLKAEGKGVNTESSSLNAQYECVVYYTDPITKKIVNYNIDWDHPAATLYLPISGYIITTGGGASSLIYSGSESLYWTSSSSDTSYDNSKARGVFGQAVRIKYAGSYESRYLYLATSEYVSNGANIRCVRDTKVD